MNPLNKYNLCLYILLLTGVMGKPASAQISYQQARDTQLTIEGKSTLHDWSMTSTEGRYNAEFEISEDRKLTKLNSLTFSIRFESLKSGSNALDKNAYSTMNTAVNKNITFKLLKALVGPQKIHCTGNLNVAGTTRPIDLDVSYQLSDNGALTCTGSTEIKMTDYNIDPPIFMFGTVRTDNDITVSFKVRLVPTNP
jgi:polyisoprenoid-binding protein YceI